MNEFRNKVAVITGAASGIGKALANRCIAEEMKVVLGDIEEDALIQTEKEIIDDGGDVLAVVTDVSKKGDLAALAQKTMDVFGGVHFLCNNAGVGAGSTVWESSAKDWKWTLDVNLWGVIYGIQEFVPIMLAQDAESYIVNTSSIAGLLPYHAGAPYLVSKHAVVALSEKTYYDLGENSGKVKISVLCPGWVKTRILESDRNRPKAYLDEITEPVITPEMVAVMQQYQLAIETGMSPDVLADQVFQAVKNNQFYILTHPEFIPIINARLEAIVRVSNPKPLVELMTSIQE
jgi:NAD(P)-dependent dehydrogenase (short-subunit alcohol dehydrogenase family)